MNKDELNKMHDRYTVVIKEDGQVKTQYNLTEREAVKLWKDSKFYENREPVSITPEPDWSKFRY